MLWLASGSFEASTDRSPPPRCVLSQQHRLNGGTVPPESPRQCGVHSTHVSQMCDVASSGRFCRLYLDAPCDHTQLFREYLGIGGGLSFQDAVFDTK